MWKGLLNLELQEFLLFTVGEFLDLIACYQITNGIAKEKIVKTKTEYIPDWR